MTPFYGVAGYDMTGEARQRYLERCRASKLAEKNPNWKGGVSDEKFAGYHSLHRWVNQQLPKPALCEACGLRPAHDCANKSGEYQRDLSDWWWICRHCHMNIDGRINNLWRGRHDLL